MNSFLPVRHAFRPTRKPAFRAFSLVELLAVMAITSMLAVVVIPAMNAIGGGRSLMKAASDISGLLEQARTYAMANNTYAYVGFSEVDGSQSESAVQTAAGTGRILVAVVASKDGTADMTVSNLAALSKPWRFNNIHLDDAVANSGNLSRPDVAPENNVGSASFAALGSFNWPLTGTASYSFSKVIRFDPRGSATVRAGSTVLPQWIEVGLAPAKGNATPQSANTAALVLGGVTGSVKIYRP